MNAKGMAMFLVLFLLSVNLGCKKADKVEQKTSEQPKTTVLTSVVEYAFEDGAGKWWTIGDVKTAQDTSKKHSGNASVKISGTAPVEKWNYAQLERFPLEKGKKYRLTGWMLVDSVSDSKYPPLLLVAVYENQKWLLNAITAKYDLNKKGEWQLLSSEFIAPQSEGIQGYVSLAKGTKDVTLNAVIFLDDIKVEAVQ